ncbi:PDZ domain-containing protein [Pseudomonas sp. KK4]|uniref:PDZ domain-containing protein n=1 Tax=Pseudomonas sp. KK4 TaxID=1855729 RepID=UPI0009F85692|nr:PDZ domain-containing protein [Pseudomonas sp. KK4]
MRRLISFAVIALTTASLTGCLGPVEFINMGQEASSGTETPESVGMAPANYRGRSCLALAVEREKSQDLAVYVGEHQNYVRKHAQWAVTSIEQVERETGCLPGATSTQVAAMDVVIREPSAAKELQSRMPPGADEYIKGGGRVSPGSTFAAPNKTAAAQVAGVPSAEPLQGASSISAQVPQQTSKAQWIANETAAKYQGRSCEYLQLAMAVSVRAEASTDTDVRSLASAKKKSVGEVLATRSCPAPVPFLAGRLGAKVSPIDPIKAARLGMPLAGASVEQVIPGSSASRAGLMFADVVVAVDDINVGDDVDFLVALNKIPTGSTVVLKISRNGAFGFLPVVLGQPVQ